MPTPADDIRAFIHAKYPQAAIDDDQDIFALGFVNSLFALELVMHIEKTFGIRIANDDIKLDNFRTVVAMAELVERSATPAAVSG